jgi:hypothetical protein
MATRWKRTIVDAQDRDGWEARLLWEVPIDAETNSRNEAVDGLDN